MQEAPRAFLLLTTTHAANGPKGRSSYTYQDLVSDSADRLYLYTYLE